jgi:hypothetical protein
MKGPSVVLMFVFMLLLGGCKKERSVFPDNDIPHFGEIPTIVVRNYVNRMFIDLIGREPLDSEMNAEVAALRNAGLSQQARKTLANRLMSSTASIQGDISYNQAYHHKVYENLKARFMEGASDAVIEQDRGNALFAAQVDSLAGDFAGYQRNKLIADKLLLVLQSKEQYRTGQIGVREMCRRMLDNSIYDLINMNTFNFVNAMFDDLFYRFPSEPEFEACYQIVENNQPAVLMGQVIQNKGELLAFVVQSAEYEEGMIRWVFFSLLAREPETAEVYQLQPDFKTTSNLKKLHEYVVVKDEYAGFD